MLKTASKQFKFVLVGDSAVGKSSLLNRFVDKSFSESFLSTIGVDFKFKKIKLDNNDIKLQIWDTAGQQTFRSIVSAYYTSANAIVIVYDITSYDSFENVKNYWITQAENNNKNNAKIFLIGNKIDQESRRQVEKFNLDAFVEQHQIDGTYEASAKTGQNVQQAFTDIARNLYFGTKQGLSTVKDSKNVKQQKRTSKIDQKPNKKSIHSDNNEEPKQEQQYEEVISVDSEARKDKVQDRQKEGRIKINPNQPNKPKNPNYNKSCCLK